MGKKRNRRIIAAILSLMIAISAFNVGNGSEHVVKAEGNEEVTESVIDAGGNNADISEENTEGVSTEGINSTDAGTENSITEDAEESVAKEDSTEGISNEESTQAGADKSKNSDGKFQGDGYTVDFVLDNVWGSGFNATVTITNTSDAKIENWSLILPLDNKFSNIWNAVVADTYDDFYVIKNAGWNQDIQVNGNVSFGITSYEKFAGFPEYYTIVGKKVETKTSDYTVEYAVTDAWEDGNIGQIKITNTRDTAIEDWRLHFSYGAEIIEIWDGVIVSHENNIYEISCENYNQNIQAGEFVTFGFKVSSGAVGEPAGMKLEEYSDGIKKYIAVMGEQIEDGILFSTICSNKCDEYVYYISKDGKDYSELSRTQENEFLYEDKGRKEGKLYFYVVGNNKSENLKSECVIVEYSDIECFITNYDTDSDLLCDYLEYCYGTDVENKDTDGDGLSDYYEVEYTMTDPLLEDTDDNMVKDSDEDFDDDKLSNIEEFGYMTNPCSYDTDEDGFSDCYEINHNMNPLIYDEIQLNSRVISTLNDYSEVDLQVMNVDEYYPLEIEYNEELVMSISGKYSDIKVESPIEALYAIYNVKTLLGLDKPEEQLKLIKVDHNYSGNVYSFKQIYNGLEIRGNNVVVSVDDGGKTTSLCSVITSEKNLPSNTDKGFLSEGDISNIIKSDDKDYDIITCNMILYKNEFDSPLFYAYDIIVKVGSDVYNKVINAITGEIVLSYLFRDSILTTGKGYADSGEIVSFPVNYISNKYYLEYITKKIFMYDASKSRNPVTSNNNKWNDKNAVSAYINSIKAYNWWKDKFKYRGLNGKNGNTPIYIHYPNLTNNSYMTLELIPQSVNGKVIYNIQEVIRLGDYKDEKQVSAPPLAVTGHEFTHSVFYHKTIAFAGDIKKKAKTIDEAYGDIFGSFIDNDKWIKTPRNIEDPITSQHPSVIDGKYYDSKYKEEHTNCTILSHAAYLMQDAGISFDKLHKLWYDSMSEGIHYWADFSTVRTCVLKAARKNKFSFDEIVKIKKAFDEVGISGEKGKVNVIVLSGDEPVKNVNVSLSYYDNKIIRTTDSKGKVVFKNVEVGTSKLKIEADGFKPVYTQVLVKKNKTKNKYIYLLSAKSNFKWQRYDHYNYKQPYVEVIPEHIEFDGDNIKMVGYTKDCIKDFLLTDNINGYDGMIKFDQKFLSFKIKSENNNWHTIEGGGFLFNVKKTKNKINGYCVLITKEGLILYELKNVNAQELSDGKLGDISRNGTRLGKYKIGNVLKTHEIEMRVTNTNVSLWCDEKLIIDNYKLLNKYGCDFGPIVSHKSHDCKQVSCFTFSDIQMSSVSE